MTGTLPGSSLPGFELGGHGTSFPRWVCSGGQGVTFTRKGRVFGSVLSLSAYPPALVARSPIVFFLDSPGGRRFRGGIDRNRHSRAPSPESEAQIVEERGDDGRGP